MDSKQLYEKQSNQFNPFFPIVRLEDIIDKITDKSIQWILNNYNHIYVEYSESREITRDKVPQMLRRSGLWISYNNGKKNITEYYLGENTNVNNYLEWTSDDNWKEFDELIIQDKTITYQHLSDALRQLLTGGNTITNFPDEEDITSDGTVLSFKDREYDPHTFSGLGKVILRKNLKIVDGQPKNILTQEMINKENTIYEIRYDFDLGGKEIIIPEGCVLDFQGGSLSNGSIAGDYTIIHSSLNRIFRDITFKGAWSIPNINISWFEIEGNDITKALQSSLSLARLYSHENEKFDESYVRIYIAKGIYTISKTIEYLTKKEDIRTTMGIEFDFNNSSIVINSELGFNLRTRYLKFVNCVVYGKEYTNDAIRLTHYNTSYATFIFENVVAYNLRVFLDTISFSESRSASLTISKCVFRCYKPVISWTDMFLFFDCKVKQQDLNTDDCYISCRGTSAFVNSIFNPNGATNFTVEELSSMDRRWIDYRHFCEDKVTVTENSNLIIRDCRFGSELGAMPALYNWSDGVMQTEGPGSSRAVITIESSVFGIRVSKYSSAVVLQAMPLSISFDNCFVRHSRSTRINPPLLVCRGENFIEPQLNYLGERIIVNNIVGHDSQLGNTLHSLVPSNLLKYTHFNTLGDHISRANYESRMFHFPNVGGVRLIADLDPEEVDLCFTAVIFISTQRLKVRVHIYKETNTASENYGEIVSYIEGLSYLQTIVSKLNISNSFLVKKDANKIILAVYSGYTGKNTVLSVERSKGVVWYKDVGIDIVETDFEIADFESLEVSGVHDRFGANIDEMRVDNGQMVYNIATWTPYWKTTTGFKDAIGRPYGIKHVGASEDRISILPSDVETGFLFFDGDQQRPAYSTSRGWKDANGFRFTANRGTSDERPTGVNNGGIFYPIEDIGYAYYDMDLGKIIYAKKMANNGVITWADALGVDINALRIGLFSEKPTVDRNDITVGFSYFCTDRQTAEGTTNGIMIYHKGEDVWVDALGRVVE